MSKKSLIVLGSLFVVSACAEPLSTPVVLQPQDEPPSSIAEYEPIPGQYIVVLKDQGSSPEGVASFIRLNPTGEVLHTYTRALRGFAARLTPSELDALRNDPAVDYVEQDQIMRVVTTQTGATWGLDRTDQRALPLSTSYTYTNTGSGVSVYIIDTGMLLNHVDFGGRAVSGFDAVDGGTADDCNGHGTHVGGTAGGNTWGIAKGARLVAVRVLDCAGSGTNSGVIAGVDWVTANHVKPAVANMSLGGGASTALDDAVNRSISAGVSYAIAAGNGNRGGRQQDACGYSPARVPAAITIGATNSSDAKASWSNYGNCVDFFAPGVSITSAWHNNSYGGSSSTSGTRTISGTSMATPHVAGVAALYLQSNPGASPAAVRDALYANTTKSIVTNSSTANNHLLYSNY